VVVNIFLVFPGYLGHECFHPWYWNELYFRSFYLGKDWVAAAENEYGEISNLPAPLDLSEK